MKNLHSDKNLWLEKLLKTSLPSFGKNIQKLSNTEEFVGSHAAELVRIILKDPGLTTSVLKLVNSVQFNTHGNSIRTVSRAVMLLGHKTIKDICTSCLLIENFIQENTSETLKSLLARSFHAAIQAKEIANIRSDKGVEEIFISTLLLNIGEIAVYASFVPNDKMINNLMSHYPFEGGKEKDLIGCYFSELTLALCNQWGIAPMVSEMLNGNYSETSACRSILLANSIANCCEKYGIEAAIKQHARTISIYCKKSPDFVSERLQSAAETSNNLLKSFGIKLESFSQRKPKVINNIPFEIVISKSKQLDAIQELSNLVQGKFDINVALRLLLEGISRGAGFNGCLVGLFNPERTKIKAKHIIETDNGQLRKNFDFKYTVQLPEIQQKVFLSRHVVLLQDLRLKGMTRLEIEKHIQHPHSIWGPLIVEGQVIGCIYADNGVFDQPISSEQIKAFKLFVYQSKSNLNYLS